jgi:formamidopyrimidine-DNA glycosylase
MIELPEAATIARQLERELPGKRSVSADTGSSPHKWVFYTPDRRQLEKTLRGRTVGGATSVGRGIHVGLSGGLTLVVDDFGGRVLYHRPGEQIPTKYHLAVRFDDDSCVTVAVQGWGFIGLLAGRPLREHIQKRAAGLSPVGRGFTLKRFYGLFADCGDQGKEPIKTFFTSGKNVAGIGNGYLQDVLFRAGIDPRRKVAEITAQERRALYKAVKETIRQAVSLNGRECERDLYGKPGKYKPLMDRRAQGNPCPACGAPVEKIQYLGGSCYVCPTCQR